SDFATVTGSDATVAIVNHPPAVSMGHLETELHLRDLGRERTLSVPLSIDEPAMVTIQLINRKHKVVREVTLSPSSARAVLASPPPRPPGQFPPPRGRRRPGGGAGRPDPPAAPSSSLEARIAPPPIGGGATRRLRRPAFGP